MALTKYYDWPQFAHKTKLNQFKRSIAQFSYSQAEKIFISLSQSVSLTLLAHSCCQAAVAAHFKSIGNTMLEPT